MISPPTDRDLARYAGGVLTSDPSTILYHRWTCRLALRAEKEGLIIRDARIASATPIPADKLNKVLETLKMRLISEDELAGTRKYISNDSLIAMRNRSTQGGYTPFYNITTVNEADLQLFETLRTEATRKKTNQIHMLTYNSSGWDVTYIGEGSQKLEKGNYAPEVLSSFDYITGELNGEAPPGRLVILHGEPGTGKTYFIRGIIDRVDKVKTLLLPVRFATKMDDPDLLTTLIDSIYDERYPGSPSDNKTPLLIVVEDADQILVNRDEGNMSAISCLLNLADGIYGSLLDVRILVTTNAGELDIDSALLRPGRLLDKISIKRLDQAQSNKVYNRLTGKDLDEVKEKGMTLSEIYAKAGDFRNQEVKKKKKQKRISGFVAPSKEKKE